jgi:hypothetical protein
VEVSVPEFDERTSEQSLRPRGRRAAPRSRVAIALEPFAPAVAATTAWLSKHRLGALIAAASLATVAMLGGGIALIQSAGAGAGASGDNRDGGDPYSMLDDPRPTSTAPAGPSPFGPILPTPAPRPATPTPTPTPTPSPDDAIEPPAVDEPVVEPEPTTEPDPPGRGNGPKKPKG